MTVLFDTPNLIVNSVRHEHLDLYTKLFMSSGVRRLMYTKAKDELQISNWIDESISHQAEHGLSDGTVFEKGTKHFIGRAGLSPVNAYAEGDDVEVNCYLLEDYWLKGYGLELVKSALKWGFEVHNLNKIVATVYYKNIPAQKLAEKAGMVFTGIKLYKNVDFMWYEIKREDFVES